MWPRDRPSERRACTLGVRTYIGSEALQDFDTALMVRIETQIAILSTSFTLEPGDIVCTGTHRGVAVHRTPPRSMMPGEHVRVEIDGLGALENLVIEELPAQLYGFTRLSQAT